MECKSSKNDFEVLCGFAVFGFFQFDLAKLTKTTIMWSYPEIKVVTMRTSWLISFFLHLTAYFGNSALGDMLTEPCLLKLRQQ